MIRELPWDSNFFKRRIGELKISHESFSRLEAELKEARSSGFQYLVCKTDLRNSGIARFLVSSGFYLSDVGITWSLQTGTPFRATRGGKSRISPKPAGAADIPMLKRMAKALFLDSRFYHDPFFSKKDADRLFSAWIENSVKGLAADIVFCVPGKGFITCDSSGRSGRIVLIGVARGSRGEGIGTALVREAVRWCRRKGLSSVSVRTQLRNLPAMNFYSGLGFAVKSHDMVFGRIL